MQKRTVPEEGETRLDSDADPHLHPSPTETTLPMYPQPEAPIWQLELIQLLQYLDRYPQGCMTLEETDFLFSGGLSLPGSLSAPLPRLHSPSHSQVSSGSS